MSFFFKLLLRTLFEPCSMLFGSFVQPCHERRLSKTRNEKVLESAALEIRKP